MKKSLSIAIIGILCVAFVIWLTGCASTGGLNPVVLQIADTSVEVIVKDVTHLTLQKKPEWRKDFETAYADVSVLAAQDKVDIATLAEIVNRLPVKEIKGTNAQLIISDVEIVVQKFAPNNGQIVSTEKYADAKAIATAIRDGLRIGLDMP